MLELLATFLFSLLTMLVIGYLSVKVVIWGSLATGAVWSMAHIVPYFSPGEVAAELVPHLMDMALVYPTAIQMTYASQTAEAGIVGGIVVAVLAIIWAIPYCIGCSLALLTWPELFVFRVIV